MIKCCLEWIVSRIIHFLRLFRYERCLWRLLFKIKSRINSLLALDRNFKRFDPISTIRSKCVLKKVFSTNMIFRIFHLFSSPLDTFVIAGEISRNLVFFSTHLVYQQGNESHHLLSLVARAARCPEKNGKTQEAREIKASRSFARANDRVCHDFNLLFFSLSLSSPLLFFLFFFFYIYIHIHRYHALNVFYVLPGLFTFCPVVGRAYIVRSSGRKNLQREIEFLYGLLVAPSGFTG